MNRQLHFICQISSTGFFETGSRLISDEWLIVGFKASLSLHISKVLEYGDVFFSSVIANSSKL
jgi:hypothetical protein